MSEVKHLLPVVSKYFKANLHTHSTITDGKFSPEELKELWKCNDQIAAQNVERLENMDLKKNKLFHHII